LSFLSFFGSLIEELKIERIVMIRTKEEWVREYEKKNALFIHDENPRRPHPLLTSGNHSNGFFNSRLVIPDEVLLRQAASDLLFKFVLIGGDISEVHGVVGPQTGATKLAEFLSDEIRHRNGGGCFHASPAKQEEDGKKSMVFSKEELDLLPGCNILLCEDVLTTGGSVDLAADAIASASGITLPFLLVLVNRSGLTHVNGKMILALIDQSMPTWSPEECPLCKEGSEAIRAKGENWFRLTANY
jgi:orotate phosphoribosyltransferase